MVAILTLDTLYLHSIGKYLAFKTQTNLFSANLKYVSFVFISSISPRVLLGLKKAQQVFKIPELHCCDSFRTPQSTALQEAQSRESKNKIDPENFLRKVWGFY